MKGKKQKQQNNGGNTITNYLTTNRDRVTKKKAENKIETIDIHDSSREMDVLSSKTEVMDDERDQDLKNKNETIQIKSTRPPEVCLQYIMIGPLDVSYTYAFKKRLKQLSESFSKKGVIKMILENAKYTSTKNLKILQKVDDDQFWNQTAPNMIEYLLEERKQKLISSCIQMLIPGSSSTISLTKLQILMIICNMFMCMLPNQSHRKYLNFLFFMSEHQSNDKKQDSFFQIKLQKLKCIINYLKIMFKRPLRQLQKQTIQIQRSVSEQTIKQQYKGDIQYRMAQVKIQRGLIEQYDKKCIMVDFANKKIGGGILGRGAVQEQILFLIFPELIATMCVCYEMQQNEAIIIYRPERFNTYEGYSNDFTFKGTFEPDKKNTGPHESVIMAVDAIDFKDHPFTQYRPFHIEREISKFLTGVQATQYQAENMIICTGRWGCGAFQGDIYLKFLIQWIACSVCVKRMLYLAQTEQEENQLNSLVKYLGKFDTLNIIQVIEEYHQVISPSRQTQITFLDFVKRHIS